MLKRFPLFLIALKICFLCISIFLLLQGVQKNKGESGYNSAIVEFTVDRDRADVNTQINTIEQIIDTLTGQSVSLRTINSGTTTLLLPATNDYFTYKVYLHSLAFADGGTGEEHISSSFDIEKNIITGDSSTGYYVLMIIFMLLALFL